VLRLLLRLRLRRACSHLCEQERPHAPRGARLRLSAQQTLRHAGKGGVPRLAHVEEAELRQLLRLRVLWYKRPAGSESSSGGARARAGQVLPLLLPLLQWGDGQQQAHERLLRRLRPAAAAAAASADAAQACPRPREHGGHGQQQAGEVVC
jgi:hypothetical protein